MIPSSDRRGRRAITSRPSQRWEVWSAFSPSIDCSWVRGWIIVAAASRRMPRAVPTMARRQAGSPGMTCCLHWKSGSSKGVHRNRSSPPCIRIMIRQRAWQRSGLGVPTLPSSYIRAGAIGSKPAAMSAVLVDNPNLPGARHRSRRDRQDRVGADRQVAPWPISRRAR